ncbi:MAG: M81 family metallopeptidase, partial [Pseudomonadota bacterium]|nr:M81 family metallopeptidase [Pseudomonadota bacterium]
MAAKRIAVLGFSLESNRFAPPCGEADFRERSFLVGEEICLDARAEHPAHDLSLTGFYADMDAACGGAAGWQAVPIRFIASMPAGPVEEAFFKDFLENCRRDLAAAQPVDGVYICEHGGAIA